MNKKQEDDEHLSNRDKKFRPKTGVGWCVCDKYYLGSSEKCPGCGRRNSRRRFKK